MPTPQLAADKRGSVWFLRRKGPASAVWQNSAKAASTKSARVINPLNPFSQRIDLTEHCNQSRVPKCNIPDYLKTQVLCGKAGNALAIFHSLKIHPHSGLQLARQLAEAVLHFAAVQA